eukprot:352461-Rhodomonas_salina.5
MKEPIIEFHKEVGGKVKSIHDLLNTVGTSRKLIIHFLNRLRVLQSCVFEETRQGSRQKIVMTRMFGAVQR